MSVIESDRSVPLGAVSAFRFVSLFERALDAYHTWRSARLTAAELSALSDSQLEDIGVVRADIPEVSRALADR